MKTCTVCDTAKEINEFDRMRNSKKEMVPTSRCKDCRKAYMRKYTQERNGKTGLSREEWLRSVRKPQYSPEERIKLGKAKWDSWYEGCKETMKAESREKALQERLERAACECKICTKCEKELPLTDFSLRVRKRKDGSRYKTPHATCRACKNLADTKYNKKYNKSPVGRKIKSRGRALRDQRVREATPKWLTQVQKDQIVAVYEHMRDCRAVTGEDYHVDHIVPLNGVDVCGLHVPWNLQVLPAYINISKSNKF